MTGPNTYAFGYQIEDAATGNVQFRDERRYLNGSVEGSYGYLRPDDLIQVTRYRADEKGGYSAHTQSYAPGDPLKDTVWPAQTSALPELLSNTNKLPPAVNVSWDAKSHLNVSVDEVEDELAEELKAEHGLDLNHIDVEHDLQPELLDIINGKTPLREQPNGSLAFETLQHAIPDDVLPLVPFQLPAEQLLTTGATQVAPTTAGTTTTGGTLTMKGATVEGATESSKYNKSKSNNDAKAPQVAAPVTTGETIEALPPPRPLVNPDGQSSMASNSSSDWYQQIIQANRREFLEHLPNLHTKRATV